MMAPDRPPLLDCGHVGEFTGICQYNRCGKRLCPDCTGVCEACGIVLCRHHQVWLDRQRRVFCPDDSRRYLKRKVVLRILQWR